MDGKLLQQFKQQIARTKLDLVEQMQRQNQTETVELDQSRVGRLSRMDSLQSQQIALDAQRRNERRIIALDGALRRIESGDFGYCFQCGEQIPVQRLQFDPAVTRCVNCTNQQ